MVSVLVAFETYSLSRRGTESALFARVRKVSKALAPLGEYLLPLDSAQACSALRVKFECERIEEDNGPPPWRPRRSTR